MPLSPVDKEVRKLGKKRLPEAIREGDPDRAVAWARKLAQLRRKEQRGATRG